MSPNVPWRQVFSAQHRDCGDGRIETQRRKERKDKKGNILLGGLCAFAVNNQVAAAAERNARESTLEQRDR